MSTPWSLGCASRAYAGSWRRCSRAIGRWKTSSTTIWRTRSAWGLVAVHHGFLEIANPIYREVIPRALTYAQQVTIPREAATFVRADGSLDMGKRLADWQTFWRKDGHLAARGFGYREAGPHLMLMTFLQRVVNGGGRVEREYGLGRGALDLMYVREVAHEEQKIRLVGC